MNETWIKEFCPKCQTVNWIYIGDMNDTTNGVDIDGYKCRKCGHIEFLGDDDLYDFEAEQGVWESIEDCNWKLGLENP